MSTVNLVIDKIPMNWFEIPGDPEDQVNKPACKGKRIECIMLKNPKYPILYTIKTKHSPDHELSKKFDETLVNAIKAMGDKRNDKIVLKGVTTFHSKKTWVYPVSGCEIIVMSAKTKGPTFREVVTGENKKQEQTEQPTSEKDLGNENQSMENENIVDKIMDEAFNMDLDGGSVSA